MQREAKIQTQFFLNKKKKWRETITMCPVVELAHGGEDPLQVACQGARVCTIPNTKPTGKHAQSEAVTDSTIRETGASLTLEVVIDVHAGAGDRHAGRRCAGGCRGSGLGDLGTRVSEEAPEIRGELEREIRFGPRGGPVSWA